MNQLDRTVERVALRIAIARSKGQDSDRLPLMVLEELIEAVERSRPETTASVLDEVLRATCSEFGVNLNAIRGRQRGATLFLAREMFYYAGREFARASYPEIGAAVHKDHTTVRTGYVRVIDRMKSGDCLTTARVGRLMMRVKT